MSRIHEALKRAEQERAAQEPIERVTSAHELLPLGAAASAGIDVSAGPTASVSDALPPAGLTRLDDLRARCAKVRWRLDPDQNIFLGSDPATPGAEQFRTLRSRLYQLRGDQPLRTVLVTSSIPAEGKSFIVNNLAQAIVRQPDRGVLIIDADLRNPRLHLALGAPAAPGLTEYLRGEADELSVMQMGQESNLCLIPGGNEVINPSELLSNGRLKELLDRVSSVFDWVIVDSPPCVPVADANMLAGTCDGVLLVVRYGSTPAELAQKAVHDLQGRNVVGVVLNATEKAGLYDSYYYQTYQYGGAAATA